MVKQTLNLTIPERSYTIPLAAISVPLYHSVLGKQVWSPLRYTNGAIYFGDEQSYLVEFLQKFLRRPNRDSYLFETLLLSTSPSGLEIPKSKLLKQQLWQGGFTSLIGELYNLRAQIRETTASKGRLEANRKISLIVWKLDEMDLAALRDPRILQNFMAVLKDADRERFFFMLALPLAQQLPREVEAMLEWQLFAGEANSTYVREVLYPTYYEELYNEKRELVGILKEKNTEALLPVHEIAYIPSTYRKQTEAVAKLEEETYSQWLESIPAAE